MINLSEPRTRLALVAAFSLISLIAMLFMQEWEKFLISPVTGFFLKLGILSFSLWLAWPNLSKIGRELPPQILLLSAIAVLTFFVNSRIGSFFLLAVAAYYFGWRVYRVVFVGRRKK